MNAEEQEVIESDKRILQSYKLTTIRNKFGLYAQRAILRVVEAVQEELTDISFKEKDAAGNVIVRKGLSLSGEKKDMRKIPVQTDLFGNKTIKLDLRCLCPDGVVHFEPIREDLKSLKELNFEYEDDKQWEIYSFLSSIKVEKGNWVCELEISKSFWEVLLDFSAGFRRVEIEAAMKFRSVYSLRLFQLLSGQTEPITYKVDELRRMFGLEDKYTGKGASMFVSRVIEKAKKELDEISPITFDYEVGLATPTDGPGRPFISTITFKPTRRIKVNNDGNFNYLKNKMPLQTLIGKKEYEILTSQFDFLDKQIKNNLNLIMLAEKKFNLCTFLKKIQIPAVRAKKSPQAYVIGAIKKELKNSFGIELTKPKK